MIEVRNVVNEILCDELIDELCPEAIDFHGLPASPVEQRLFQFRRTRLRLAAADGLTFLTINLASAHRTTRRHLERYTIRSRFDDTDNLGNDVAASFEQNTIVDLNAKTRDLVFVMKRCIPDRGAAQLHGLEF